MRKLATKILALITIVVAINMLIRMCVPTYWWSSTAYTKNKFYELNKKQYNLLLLGSSRTRSGVNPLKFDADFNALVDSKNHIQSFNYAVPASTSGEIFYTADMILDNPPLNLEYLIVELRSSTQSIAAEANKKNRHTDRRRWSLNFGNYIFAIRQLLDNVYIDSKKKIEYFSNYSISFVENTFSAGMFTIFVKVGATKMYDANQLGLHNNGYKALDFTKNKQNIAKHKAFLKNGQYKINLRKEASISAFSTPNATFSYNSVYLEKVNKLIKKGAEKGIDVVFLATPLLSTQANYEEIKATTDMITNKHKIVLTDANKYPKFYDINYLWDEGHFNKQGSDLYSKVLAKKLSAIMQ